MSDAAVPLALAYETPDLATDRRDLDVPRLARLCVVAALCSLGYSLVYVVAEAFRGRNSAVLLLWTPVMAVMAVMLICCLFIRPRRGLDGRGRRRVMRCWWVALAAHVAVSLISTAIRIVTARPGRDMGV